MSVIEALEEVRCLGIRRRRCELGSGCFFSLPAALLEPVGLSS